MNAESYIACVSGLPRSGTSMIMRMLDHGGMAILSDGVRGADEDNPRGYYEYEKVKRLHEDASWVAEARGKVVKVVSPLLGYLPPGFPYKVVFVRRNIREILESQRKMLLRSGKKADRGEDAPLAARFESHLNKLGDWLEAQPNIDCLYVHYNDVIGSPLDEAARIRAFLGRPLDVDAMASAVDASLYRNRVAPGRA